MFVDVFVVSETKTNGSFPGGNGGVILLYVPEDIPAKVIHSDFPTSEKFHVDINLRKKKWLLNCSCKPHKNNICNHLDYH